MGSRSESYQETKGSTEKVVFEMRIAIWLGWWHLEGLTQGYSKRRRQNLQRCRTHRQRSKFRLFLWCQCHQRIKLKGAWPKLRLLARQGRDGLVSLPALTLYTFPRCSYCSECILQKHGRRAVGYVRIHFILQKDHTERTEPGLKTRERSEHQNQYSVLL